MQKKSTKPIKKTWQMHWLIKVTLIVILILVFFSSIYFIYLISKKGNILFNKQAPNSSLKAESKIVQLKNLKLEKIEIGKDEYDSILYIISVKEGNLYLPLLAKIYNTNIDETLPDAAMIFRASSLKDLYFEENYVIAKSNPAIFNQAPYSVYQIEEYQGKYYAANLGTVNHQFVNGPFELAIFLKSEVGHNCERLTKGLNSINYTHERIDKLFENGCFKNFVSSLEGLSFSFKENVTIKIVPKDRAYFFEKYIHCGKQCQYRTGLIFD